MRHAKRRRHKITNSENDMPNKYSKKPVVIEAIQYDGQNLNEVMGFLNDADGIVNSYFACEATGGIGINTLEGLMMASIDDYIIKGIAGEFYPCKPLIFEATYEKVEEQQCTEK